MTVSSVNSLAEIFDFENYTLSDAQIIQAAILFCCILGGVFSYGLMNYPKDNKRLAWTISVVNSGLMSIVALIYLYHKLPTYNNIFLMHDNGLKPFHGKTNITTLVLLWFGLANIFDLVLGTIFYPKYLGVLTAYIHHTVFIWICWTGATGNGFFMTATPYGPAFCLMLIEEVPTFLLALGSISASYRSDLGFGISFFLLRLCYHFYFFVYAIKSGAATLILIIWVGAFTLHCFWFYGWFSKYSGLTAQGKKDSISEKRKSGRFSEKIKSI
jgi:hypothetical protein